MQHIPRDLARKYAFDWRDEPLLTVEPGEPFTVETFDASTGYFRTAADKADPKLRPGFDRSPPHANPIAGAVCRRSTKAGAQNHASSTSTLVKRSFSDRPGGFAMHASATIKGSTVASGLEARENCPTT
jgi:hypothetical protein